MDGGISQQQSQGRHSHTSTSFMLRMMGSTDSTTAVGRLRVGRFCTSRAFSWPREEKTLALPSLPNRMTRLSKTARPLISTGRAAPTKASAVMR